jgi:predicted DNA-binding antitoxin AbrB/MazE fold protein
MPSIEVIYENGVFRPVHPLDLEEGTRLEMTVIRIDSAIPTRAFPGQDQGNGQEQEGDDTGQVDEATYKKLSEKSV